MVGKMKLIEMLNTTRHAGRRHGLRSWEVGGDAVVIAAGSGSLLNPHWFWLSNGVVHNKCKPIYQGKGRLDWAAWHGPFEWLPLPQTKQDTFECYLLRANLWCSWSGRIDKVSRGYRFELHPDLISQSGLKKIKRLFSGSKLFFQSCYK